MELGVALGVLSVVGGLNYAAATRDAHADHQARYQQDIADISDRTYRRAVPQAVGAQSFRNFWDGFYAQNYTFLGYSMGSGGKVDAVYRDNILGQEYHRPAEGRFASPL